MTEEKNITPEAKAIRNEYIRKWRSKNKDKVRQYNENYWNNLAQKLNKGGEEDGQ